MPKNKKGSVMNFSNSTIANVKKESKKIRNCEKITHKKALDIVSQQKGFKSFKDLNNSFAHWSKNKFTICIVLKKTNKIKLNYYKNEGDNYLYSREVNIDELNNVQKFGLKRLNFQTLIEFIQFNEIKGKSRYLDLIEESFEDYLFFDYNLKELNIDKMKKNFMLSDGSIFKEKYDEQLFYEIQGDLLIIKKHDDQNNFEELLLSNEYLVFNEKIYDVIAMYNNEFASDDFIMTSDFYV